MNLVLIGYRGTGKTTVAKILAERLGMRYVGMDGEIVKRAGKSIPEIVAGQGWQGFREIEAEVAKEVGKLDGCVVDTGGGVILRPDNVENLRRNGIVFWLQASVADIVKRIGSDTQRPSLTGTRSFTDEVEEVLAERMSKYAAAADESVNTSEMTVEEVVEFIAVRFRARCAENRSV